VWDRGGNRPDRPIGAYDLAYIKSDLVGLFKKLIKLNRPDLGLLKSLISPIGRSIYMYIYLYYFFGVSIYMCHCIEQNTWYN